MEMSGTGKEWLDKLGFPRHQGRREIDNSSILTVQDRQDLIALNMVLLINSHAHKC